MEFSTWLRDLRKNRLSEIGITDLAYRAGISQSAVSRIESGEITPTVETVVKLLSALGGNVSDLYAAVSGKIIGSMPSTDKRGNFPSINDIQAIEHLASKDDTGVSAMVFNLYKQTVGHLVTGDSALSSAWIKEMDPKVVHPFIYNMPNITAEIAYPPNIDKETIELIVSENGVVIRQDVTAYLRDKLRDRKRISKRSIDHNFTMKLDYSGPFTEAIGKVRFDTLLSMDDELSSSGEIFVMAWKAAEYELYRSKKVTDLFALDQGKLGYTLIVLSRWLALQKDPNKWLSELRK